MSLLTAIFTGLLVLVGFFTAWYTRKIFLVAERELKNMSEISAAKFITDYEESFFTDDAFKKHWPSIEKGTVKFINEEGNKHFIDEKTKDIINTCEMDGLLGYFESLYILKKRNMITGELIQDIFKYYADILWDLISKDYLSFVRMKDKDSFSGFENLIKSFIND